MYLGFLKCFFEKEVSEIYDGIVELKLVVCEVGDCLKIFVYFEYVEVDLVGFCVGLKG